MSYLRAWTLPLGLLIIAVCEAMLFVDVQNRGGLVIDESLSPRDLPRPDEGDTLAQAARWFAVNMTAFCWIGFLLVADGVLVLLARFRRDDAIASLRARPNRFVVAWLTSIPVWCFFDAVNFYGMDAWRYHGLPPHFEQRVLGYFVAFAAITPGMLLAAQAYLALFTRTTASARAPSPSEREEGEQSPRLHLAQDHSDTLAWALVLGPWAAMVLCVLLLPSDRVGNNASRMITLVFLTLPVILQLKRRESPRSVAFVIGATFLLWTLYARDPLANFTLWVGLIYLLDPLNTFLSPRSPSLLRDWQHGRIARTLALFAGGLTCGLLWEFWNYWALAKWTYRLPFLGPLEGIRYFEMPLPGMLGFLPFAAECWVVLNTIVALLERCGLNLAEELPDDRSVI